MSGGPYLYPAFAAFWLLMGAASLFEWYRDGAAYDLLMAALMALLSAVWVLIWRRDRKRAGP